MTHRHAVYWAPEPDHPLWAAGCRWLGRDPTQAATADPPPRRVAPWRYGLHATLKAPMRLADGVTPATLHDAVALLARDHRPISLPPLQVATLGHFIALRPVRTPAALQRLAADCVTRLDPLRRPLARVEEARRSEGLDDSQRALLQRWGYPHVLKHWRFHVTLSDDLPDAAERAALLQTAAAWFEAALAVPISVASICVFEEPVAGAPLRLTQRHALRAAP